MLSKFLLLVGAPAKDVAFLPPLHSASREAFSHHVSPAPSHEKVLGEEVQGEGWGARRSFLVKMGRFLSPQ